MNKYFSPIGPWIYGGIGFLTGLVIASYPWYAAILISLVIGLMSSRLFYWHFAISYGIKNNQKYYLTNGNLLP